MKKIISIILILSIILLLSLVLCFFTSCDNSADGESDTLGGIIKTYKSRGIINWWEALALYNAGENPVNYRGFEQVYLSLEGGEYLKMAPYVIVANIAIINGSDAARFNKYEEYKTKLKNLLENPSDNYTLYDYIYAYYGLKCSGTDFNQTPVLNYFLKEQKSDGGFALIGNISDADMTALVIPALQLYYRSSEFDITGMYIDIDRSPLTNAVKFLEGQIGENGTFSYSGEDNANTTACALSAFIGYYKDGWELYDTNEIIKKASDGLELFKIKNKPEYAYLINGKADILATAQAAVALGDIKNKTSVWEKLYLDSVK